MPERSLSQRLAETDAPERNVARHRPRAWASDAVHLAKELYSLDASASPLPSDRDQNFLLETRDGRRFVMKIASALEDRSALLAQDAAMRHCRAHDLAVPTVIPGRDGEMLSEFKGEDGRRHFVRVVSYLQGRPLAAVRPKSPALLSSVGRFMGRLSAALASFDHPGAARTLPWDLLAAPGTIQRREHLVDPDRLATLEHIRRLHDEIVVPRLPDLRRSVVHNDANDYNVLVEEPASANRRVAGLLDFGDMIHSLTVSDLAVAAAYVVFDLPDLLGALSIIVRAYHSEFRLDEVEMAVLFPLIGMRLATSVCMAAEQRAAEPENDYLSISEAQAWRTLRLMAGVHPRMAECVVRDACGCEPSASSPSVREWISGHTGSLAEVIAGASRVSIHLDLSVGSSEWSFEELTTPGRAEAAIAERLQHADPPIAIGRYDEARLVYQGEQFTNGVEPRTVHIGLDLFAAPGTPVRAPLEGGVHSVADNDRPYDYGPTVILEHAPPDGPMFYTLYGHLSRESIRHLHSGRRLDAGEAFAAVGPANENGGWAPHLHFQLITDLLGREGDFPGVAPAGQRSVWTSLCPDPSALAGLARSAAAPRISPADLLERRRRNVGPSLSLSYTSPIALGRGHGTYLFDIDGRRFLDTVNNVAHVGHCHPRVTEAAGRAMSVLNTNTRYLYAGLSDYAGRLAATLPEPLSVCYIVNSGSEANDLALRLARAYTGREEVVVLENAYHGHLTSLIAVSPYKFGGSGGGGKPASTQVAPMPDVYRGEHRGADAGARYALEVGAAADRSQGGVAAFLVESAMSCGGQISLPDGYLAAAFDEIRRRGGICIADEVQTGFGRVGETFWAFQLHGVVPDVVTLGKPIGNGFPLGAVVTTPEIAQAFDNGMEYFNTYGGNPVACAAGMAVLDVIEDEGLQRHAYETGRHFLEALKEVKDRHTAVGDVRGSGLFIGVELVRDRSTRSPATDAAGYVVEQMREQGILSSRDGPQRNVLKIKPPLVLQRSDVDRYIETLDETLSEDFVEARTSG